MKNQALSTTPSFRVVLQLPSDVPVVLASGEYASSHLLAMECARNMPPTVRSCHLRYAQLRISSSLSSTPSEHGLIGYSPLQIDQFVQMHAASHFSQSVPA